MLDEELLQMKQNFLMWCVRLENVMLLKVVNNIKSHEACEDFYLHITNTQCLVHIHCGGRDPELWQVYFDNYQYPMLSTFEVVDVRNVLYLMDTITMFRDQVLLQAASVAVQ